MMIGARSRAIRGYTSNEAEKNLRKRAADRETQERLASATNEGVETRNAGSRRSVSLPTLYATVDRRAPIPDRLPEFTERMAWINAKHPSTFSGRSRRSSKRLARARLTEFRLFVPPFWP